MHGQRVEPEYTLSVRVETRLMDFAKNGRLAEKPAVFERAANTNRLLYPHRQETGACRNNDKSMFR